MHNIDPQPSVTKGLAVTLSCSLLLPQMSSASQCCIHASVRLAESIIKGFRTMQTSSKATQQIFARSLQQPCQHMRTRPAVRLS